MGNTTQGVYEAAFAVSAPHYVPYKLDNVDRSDKVVEIKVKSCWLGHGFYSSLGSAITGTFTGNSLTHWWV